MKVYKKAILPLGFKANGVASGIKESGKLDLALFYSDIPAKAACLFTTNRIQAAPIQVNKIHLKRGKGYRAIIVNSGNANCFTGESGLRDAQATAKSLAAALKIKKENTLVASTGIIGRRLPLIKIEKAVPALVKGLSGTGIDKAKRAIMTTDTFSKEATVKLAIGKNIVTICGIAKGAGMIAPDMATMLVFIFTDALISQMALTRALGASTDNSFHCITVDGCMSTNDSVMMLANGRAKNTLIDKNGRNFTVFVQGLQAICIELAKMIVRDAEGASKFIQIQVTGAKNFKQARQAALSIANSNLFKTAVYGQNPNFGRIIAAVGASGIDVREEEIRIRVSPLDRKEIKVDVSLNRGSACATVYTSDLTPEYIRINAEYN
ncbi:MAG: bifunctional glutamate N-acetyltransferase/amino-acid acetyltransferase ArgJ [Candidatus Omnitrophica bacterium]|nr:bifunctional glutamate N-acetyltransferase/amino-acid acetyltransferase ArgJ [Candidatus Omnitrophota bacterium]MDD5592840.1 bifunctional glutamate N-acetyltransferase/amino-acid acetyltransferase ArgJ [Candidatus Omnitrophota bacterium]